APAIVALCFIRYRSQNSRRTAVRHTWITDPMLKISIVIPTRNRALYLKHCIETCLSTDDTHIEVIVSDNNSTDDTHTIPALFPDPRLHYYHTGADLSMRQNFEFALSKASGDYIFFIGDDDGILKNGLSTLRKVLEKYRPDIVNWRHITYKWPNESRDSILKFRYRDFFGPLYSRAPGKVLEEFCQAKLTSFRDAAHIYHGAVARHIVEKIKQKSGGYFLGHIPDVYTALANLVVADSFLWIRSPVSIGGESPKSNGAAAAAAQKRTQEQQAINQSFVSLAASDLITPETDLRLRSIPAYVYACLIRVNKLIADNRLDIDHAAWRNVLLAESKNVAPELRLEQTRLLHILFEEADPSYTAPSQSLPASQSAVEAPEPLHTRTPAENSRTDSPVRKKMRGLRPDLSTVEEARQWIDNVMGASYLPQKNVFGALLLQMRHAAGMKCRIRKLSKKSNLDKIAS
ncbi:MAG TPA: glycosyltransferase family 2 protein, partial [Alphaproteobacteria bacterium]|nr:glycosyltransferase family 2 protein [Alphaproteobacteria bacterium]